MALSRMYRISFRIFGKRAARAVTRNAELGFALQRARMPMRPEVYLSAAYMMGAIVGAGTLVLVALLLVLALGGSVRVPLRFFILIAVAPVVVAAAAYLLFLIGPAARALTRTRNINAKLPYAINYIATMSSAGATPDQLFSSLALQPVYGEVAEEAAWISRDVRLLGFDIITALQRAIDRSPSAKMQDFLQGTVTSLTSGGELKTYFVGKSEQFILENRQDQKKFLESLGVLAESFVTVVVAAPLFMIVILSVMTSFGGDPAETQLIGYSLIFFIIPLSQAAFGWTIKIMTPEA